MTTSRQRHRMQRQSARTGRRSVFALLFALAFATAGCTTPVGVKWEDPRTVQRQLTSSILSTGKLSNATRIEFQRRNLYEALQSDPDDALARLHAVTVSENSSAGFFALAEAAFARAERTGRRSYQRAAALYAYAFLFPDEASDAPDPFDPRFRLACDLYNRGITGGFASEDGDEVVLQAALYELPFGWLNVAFDRDRLTWANRRLERFVAVADFAVRGLRNRYRFPGVGAPLAADARRRVDDDGAPEFVAPNAKVFLNAFLRVERPREQLASGRVEASLELRVGFQERQVEVGGRSVPLELETTAYLAYMLAESPVWETELRGFLLGDLTREETRLVGLAPYRPGRIPVVLVHGTASSVARWANLLNDLGNDPRINQRYQFWFFSYDTGNPIAYSAMLLRQALRDAVARFDPEGRDPALREMVIIGHSQGGLLTKLMAIDSGDRLWTAVSRVSFDELDVRDETRELLREALFVQPLPFLRRVVFICTPQRGSFIAGNRIAHWVARFAKLPSRLGRAGVDLLGAGRQAMRMPGTGRLPSSVDNMTPGNPFVQGLASIPVAPAIAAHSIIAVRGDGPVETGNDGVVEYQSAHIDGVESELVVHSGHSAQDHPDTIEEVRRILLEHAGVR